MTYDYDLAVIGGGAAGLVASKFAAGIGKKVVLIEKSKLGGECTLYGCVPSKTLIRTANAYHQMKQVDALGLDAGLPRPVPDDRVLSRVRSVVGRVYEGHRPEVVERLGIRVITGSPRFTDRHSVEIDGKKLSAGHFIICTGSSPLIPAIEGLDTVPYLTNQTIFDLERLPQSTIVLGGGPIGIEIAQAFSYLGVGVTVVEMEKQILVKEDRELSDLLADRLASSSIALRTGMKAISLAGGGGTVELTVEDRRGAQSIISGETVLLALGRKANTDSLNLEAAGIEYSPKGIKTDERLRTTARNIYACGDVAGPYQFSHMAEYQARIAARNALLPFKGRVDYRNYIWCTFTDPEFAHAGLTEEEARQQHGDRVRIYRWQYGDTDRARTEAEEFGIGKFICDQSYRLLGAHILGPRAGELIHEAQIARSLGIPFYKLDSIIHVYPTFSDVVRQPAKLAHIDRLQNSFFVKIAKTVLGGRS
jgi:pyruvate/2-oxoglutarate dehydrogenase complex dihydrolipoamide dehydrogenase (E3) component